MRHFDAKEESHSIEFLRASLIDYCLSHGLVVRPQPNVSHNPSSCLVAHAPVALYPSPFPRKLFDHAKSIQADYNELYAKISLDIDFMTKIMNELKNVDEFMKDLWELYLEVGDRASNLTLGLFRSDYLLNTSQEEDGATTIKQVEFNTISASFGALASRTAEAHRAMSQTGAYRGLAIEAEDMPVNPAVQELARGLAVAHKAYQHRHGGVSSGIAFIVQAGERNAFDQRWLEYELLETHAVASHRVSFTDVGTALSVEKDTQRLTLNSPHVQREGVEISVVYYRAGYGPEDYKSAEEWRSRRTIELSRAIKCPSIITQLAGSKKVQQVLSESGVVEKFLPSQAAADLRSTFVAMHALDDSPEGRQAVDIAFKFPEKYVLKPQREGGGNNIYRTAIPSFLESIPRSHWSGYILMELIFPPEVDNAIVRAGELFPAPVISELGIYGTILWDTKTKEILHNSEAGHLLRTKSKDTDEGGVAAGFACIDSPLLTS